MSLFCSVSAVHFPYSPTLIVWGQNIWGHSPLFSKHTWFVFPLLIWVHKSKDHSYVSFTRTHDNYSAGCPFPGWWCICGWVSYNTRLQPILSWIAGLGNWHSKASQKQTFCVSSSQTERNIPKSQGCVFTYISVNTIYSNLLQCIERSLSSKTHTSCLIILGKKEH